MAKDDSSANVPAGLSVGAKGSICKHQLPPVLDI